MVPKTELCRAILGAIRAKLYRTYERQRQPMTCGQSEILVHGMLPQKRWVLIVQRREDIAHSYGEYNSVRLVAH